ncbi:hypothetical protein J7T55_010536 [Diaporthe amygdali]|uniref:uncharacterized protein n=1 Tax=Phomopsis amygdali TaxID=1214568 RepID=UPI0022FE72C7|nr:uncharacterized protein J7T55_010536 [Diaporthe amygdali]KAJ0115713.1 hypothetical protein J7T55_010536 [Diaporthe amygdali]
MDNIYTGIWTNWSRGAILGSTLTTTKQYGNLLIAFMALFIGFVASRLWKISCLALHRCYSTADKRSPIHHQRQVILRNSRTAESALFEILCLLWAWRKSQFPRIAGLIPLTIFTFCYLTAFTAAGGFSSNISSSIGDEVLIKSQYCATIITNSTMEGSSIRNRWQSERSNSAANYVQQCYSNISQSSATTACNKFVLSSLPTYEVNASAECPFQHQICRNPQSTLRLDSGYIDSHEDLGLNAPKDKRFAYRYVLHCAPLETDNYISHVKKDGRGWDRYHYGSVPIGPADNRTGSIDYLYMIDDLHSQYSPAIRGISMAGRNFKLGIMMFRGEPDVWTPIPELMDDEWYRATVPDSLSYVSTDSGAQQTWRPNVSASPMGCVEQFQVCNLAYPKHRGCGPLAGYFDAVYGAAKYFNVTEETLDPNRPFSSNATSARFIWPLVAMNSAPTVLTAVLNSLGTASLASQSELFAGNQQPLPKNQWQLDKIRSSAYTSFSCFGLYFTVITGALITITSYSLEPILNWLHKHRQHKSYANLEWISNNSLQLHRMIHERLMGQDWANCTDDVPITDPETSLVNLDISDPEHPIIRRPQAPEKRTVSVEFSTAPALASSPIGGSFHSASAADLSGRTSTSTISSSSDWSWTLNVRSAIMSVSGQLSVEENEDGDANEDMMGATENRERA